MSDQKPREPKQIIKSFKMPPGNKSRKWCEKALENIIEARNREIREATPKHPGTDLSGEVMMSGEEVRVNLYNAIDKDAVSFGEQYTLIRLGEQK